MNALKSGRVNGDLAFMAGWPLLSSASANTSIEITKTVVRLNADFIVYSPWRNKNELRHEEESALQLRHLRAAWPHLLLLILLTVRVERRRIAYLLNRVREEIFPHVLVLIDTSGFVFSRATAGND